MFISTYHKQIKEALNNNKILDVFDEFPFVTSVESYPATRYIIDITKMKVLSTVVKESIVIDETFADSKESEVSLSIRNNSFIENQDVKRYLESVIFGNISNIIVEIHFLDYLISRMYKREVLEKDVIELLRGYEFNLKQGLNLTYSALKELFENNE